MSTGLRPKRSLRFPISGAQRNCIPAKTNCSHPPHHDAWLIDAAVVAGWPSSSAMILGATGMMTPSPIVSSSMVMKMKASA